MPFNPKHSPAQEAQKPAGTEQQLLLRVCAAGQNSENASPESMTADLKPLADAVVNVDIMLRLIDRAKAFSSNRGDFPGALN